MIASLLAAAPLPMAAAPLLIWAYLLLARGTFWRASRLILPAGTPGASARTVVAIVPARDEAAVIGEAVRSLLRQRVSAKLHVVIVDDGSVDGTGVLAAQAASSLGAAQRLTLITGAPLPAGWSGKVWAMSQGVAAAAALDPDYLLLTDADIRHDPEHVAALIAQMESGDCDLISCMVRLSAVTLAEKCLIPAFVFFFLMLYPPAWVESSGHAVAGAAGGCMLIRPRSLTRIGGLQAIRAEIIDDCALARVVKRAGGRVRLRLTRAAHSARSYGSFAEIGRMISRTAFNQLHHSYLLLAATLAGLLLAYLLPPLLLLSAQPLRIALGGAAWTLMSLCYLPMIRFYGLRTLWCLSLPAVAMFFAGATLHSAVQYRLGRGGSWKGRVQDLRPKP